MKNINFYIILIFLTVACDRNIAKVGDTIITSRDVSLRARVSEIYYPESGMAYIALSQLIKGYLAEEVLKSMGYRIDDSVIDSESRRIDANTKAPDVLNRIKEVYGNNRKAYNKTFVRIVYAERYLYNEVFLKSTFIHKEERGRAEEFLRRVIKNPERFSKIASDMQLTLKRFKISREKGVEIEEKLVKPSTPQGVEQAGFIIDKIKNVKSGSVYSEIIEWLEGYQIIRVLNKNDKEYTVESVSIQKRDFDEWFWSIAGDVPVIIHDDKLKDELLKNVPWAQRLNLKESTQ